MSPGSPLPDPALLASVRDTEARWLARCVAASADAAVEAADEAEANRFFVAALLLRSTHPVVSERLMQSAERYLNEHAIKRLAIVAMLHRGWIPPLPRMRSIRTTQLMTLQRQKSYT